MNKNLRNTKVLVTGGAGFIGSHLVDALVAQGAQVRVLDNFSTGRHENITHVIKSIELIEGDIAHQATCQEACTDREIIVHLAAIPSVPACQEDPERCYAVNVTGTFHLLAAASKAGARRLIFASSAAVYGTSDRPCMENMPCNPTSCYGYSKRLGELLCAQYARLSSLDTVCLRYFNVYGLRQRPDTGVVARMEHALKHQEPITFYGSGHQTRDFVPVERIIEANITCALFSGAFKGESFNIATGKSRSLRDMFHELSQAYPDYKHNPIYQAARAGDIEHSHASCEKYDRFCAMLEQ